MTRRSVAGWSALVTAAIAFVVIYALAGGSNGTPLDPQNPSRDGAEAVSNVLQDQGIDVRVVRRSTHLGDAVTGRSTLLVTNPDRLSADVLRSLLDTPAERLVLVDPGADTVDNMGLPVRVRSSSTHHVEGTCDIGWARGLRMSSADHLYSPDGAATSRRCLTSARGSALLTVRGDASAPRVVLVGGSDVLRNQTVTQDDNAALALRMLGRTGTLVWFSADLDGPDTVAPPNPWPRWSGPGLIVVAGAALLMVLWRGRRLGPLVPERLPAVVPAREITTARGQLYRKSKDTAHAGAVLRAATRERLRVDLGLPQGVDARALVDATSRASGRDPAEIDAVLFGPAGTDEATMTDIAQQLSTIERQVRT